MLYLSRARVPVALLPAGLRPTEFDGLEPAVPCDITVAGDRIVDVQLSGAAPVPEGAPVIDVGGGLVFPGMVDAHVHLDKTHSWHRAPNRDGTFYGALVALGQDKDNWTEEDLLLRAGFALRTAWARGTRLMRTHVDTGLPWAERSHAVMAALREDWAGKIRLQTVPLCGGEAYTSPDGEKIADLAVQYGASALGGFLQMSAELPQQIDRLLALATERNLGIDLHVDENGNPAAECLRQVAEGILRAGFTGRAACGHCCSLAVQDPARAQDTLRLVREARIDIISLPLCNLYLQDRRSAQPHFPRAPLWRGLTLIHDFLDAGVPVACANDNVRDAFHAHGDYDLHEVYVQSVRLAHLDARLAESVRVVTSAAADMLGCSDYGRIAPGARAHLVLFEAHRFSELLSRPEARRRFIDGETLHAPVLPDYAELRELSL